MGERQLHLFRGKRQQGERIPSPKEFNTHVALVSLLRHSLSPNWMFTHIASGEKRDPVTASRLKAMGVNPGWPDLIFVGPDRHTFWLELKREGGRASEQQKTVGAGLRACGHDYLITDSIELAVEALRARGIVRARVAA